LTVDPNGAKPNRAKQQGKKVENRGTGLPIPRDISLDKADCGQYKDKIPHNAACYAEWGEEKGP